MYHNIIEIDPEDGQYINLRIHRQQLIHIHKALFALKQRKLDNPESTRMGEPSADILDDIGLLISEAFQKREER